VRRSRHGRAELAPGAASFLPCCSHLTVVSHDMSDIVVLCTDGSDLANRAARAGLELLRPDAAVIIVTVIDEDDPTLVHGAGFAGGTETPEEFDRLNAARRTEGEVVVAHLAQMLGITGARTEILVGDAGEAVCDFATEVAANVVVVGTRGRGGFKRALLGSVSDHVVRNAPCSVVVTGDIADAPSV
jgi:nucleotide-binding universal stress UspA family protein